MTTLEVASLEELHEVALLDYWRAVVDGLESARFLHGMSEGLARALAELELVDPLEIHVRAVASITARSEEGRELAERARNELRARLPNRPQSH